MSNQPHSKPPTRRLPILPTLSAAMGLALVGTSAVALTASSSINDAAKQIDAGAIDVAEGRTIL